MPQLIRRYKKTQVLAGTAYTQEQCFSPQLRYDFQSVRMADVVIGHQNELYKNRYNLDRMVETYLIVNSSPVLRHLVAIYNSLFNVISRG